MVEYMIISKRMSVTVVLNLKIIHMMERLCGRHESLGYGLNIRVRSQWNRVRLSIHVKIVMLSISVWGRPVLVVGAGLHDRNIDMLSDVITYWTGPRLN